jgi:excisionase family DNA binding protein
MAKKEDFPRAELVAAAQLLAGWYVSRMFDTPPPVAALAAAAVRQDPLPAGEGERLTRKEAAELLKVSETTVDRLNRKGELHGEKVGRLTRFFRDDVERYRKRRST